MPQSLVKNFIHIVFSTKYRNDLIDEKIENELYAYIASICKDYESTALQIGGTENHIHILCLLSRKISLMKLVQEIKAHSSKWIKTKGEKYNNFYWQDGYGAFSVNPKEIYVVQQYIKNQKEHHTNKSFENELTGFLKRYRVEYDEKYLWD